VLARQLRDILATLTPYPDDKTSGDGAVVTPIEPEVWSAGETLISIQVMHEDQLIDRYPMKKEAILVGRLPSSDLQLESEIRSVSKRHCEIRRQDGQVMVRDLHSTNKTFLNDVELKPDLPTVWPEGAPLRVGSFTLQWMHATTRVPSPLPERSEGHDAGRGREIPRIECQDGKPQVLELSGKPVVIGRVPDCDMMIADPGVSKQHCAVHWDGDQIFVRDMGSSNGTVLGQERLEPHRDYSWAMGLELKIGPYLIRASF
jgi:pSer/pThr/pTyr-binding forkhead associated (FHA) protein